MSKRTGPTRVKLSDFKERKGVEGRIDVELDDGSVFTIPAPELWPEDFYRTRAKLDDADLEQTARLIVGDAEYDRFVAGGGTAVLFHALLNEEHGATAGGSQAS